MITEKSPDIKRALTQDIFEGQPQKALVAVVDADGVLKFGDSQRISFSRKTMCWEGDPRWFNIAYNTDYEPLTCIVRASIPPIDPPTEQKSRVYPTS